MTTRFLALLFLAASATAQETIVDRAPTPFVEGGKPVCLEVVIYKPPGNGPFPTVMFNHGSTGNGDKPELFKRTYSPPDIARHFTERGWMIAFPQRRGRGNSGGTYDEGFEPDRSRYSCNPQYSLPGVDRAIQDLDAALDYLRSRPDVDQKRMIVAGQSRGGALAIAYAGEHPDVFRAAIDFSGGWLGEACSGSKLVNARTFARGGRFKGPTLWLYAENDPFYSIAFDRSNFDAFRAAGGQGVFKAFEVLPGESGHMLVAHPELWGPAVDQLLKLQ